MPWKSEYGKRCGLCFKYRETRIYWGKFSDGKFKKICKECWETLTAKRVNKGEQ